MRRRSSYNCTICARYNYSVHMLHTYVKVAWWMCWGPCRLGPQLVLLRELDVQLTHAHASSFNNEKTSLVTSTLKRTKMTSEL